MSALHAQINNNFMHHAPKDEATVKKYEDMRAKCRDLAIHIADNTPTSREQSLAMTNLEQVMFWANAAIARNE